MASENYRAPSIAQSAELAEQQGVELPPLPEAFEAEFTSPGASPVSVYTAAQMREYARDALAATGKQQVGEVQGDWLPPLSPDEVAAMAPAGLTWDETGAWAMGYEACRKAALAARQPGVALADSRNGRVYIAGPMTGYENYNFPAFNSAAEMLCNDGFTPVNPADHGIVEGAGWADYLRDDIAKIATCEAIYFLPGWSKSKGATLEHHIADALGMEMRFAEGADRQPGAQVPVGYLYDWTHSSALGRGDEDFTSFTVDIEVARGSKGGVNIRPVYLAPPAQGIDLGQLRKLAMPILCPSLCASDAERMCRRLHAALIDQHDAAREASK